MSSTRSSSSDGKTTIRASDEQTPLLATASPIPTSETVQSSIQAAPNDAVHLQDEDAPLPYGQLFLLCLVRLGEPIAFFSIFPYINSMIERTGGIDKEDVGFYSGLIESLFSATQMCVMIFWGKAADRFGRKPCIVISLFGAAVATALFGMSKTIWQMIVCRCIGGVFTGTIVTVRTMISENSTKKTQARAFSYFAFAGNLGIFIGPFIGGVLERPANKFPSTFGRIRFFDNYPYALPGFATSFLMLCAAVAAVIFLRETLHIHHGQGKAKEGRMSTWKLLKTPGVGPVLLVFLYVAALAFAYTAVIPVFLYTPVNMGGTGFRPELIAGAIGLNGISQALWIIFIFPPLQIRINTGGVLRICGLIWPVFFAMHPICHLFLRFDLKALFWALGPLSMVIGSGVAMAFTATQLALNDIAPSHETLGTLNAVALALSGGMRAIVPALATSIYATGIRYNIADGQLFWIAAVALACGLPWIVRHLPEKAEGRIEREDGGP